MSSKTRNEEKRERGRSRRLSRERGATLKHASRRKKRAKKWQKKEQSASSYKRLKWVPLHSPRSFLRASRVVRDPMNPPMPQI